MNNVTLSEEQRKIVEHSGSPMRILAGPGTGKTFCIIEKVKWLLNVQKIPSKDISIITFTKAAKNEIRKRLEDSGIEPSKVPYINTLHGFAMKILRKNPSLVGLKNGFRPIKGATQKIVIKDVCEDLRMRGINLNYRDRKYYQESLSKYKSLADLPIVISQNGLQRKRFDLFEKFYSDNLDFYNCVDFTDILIKSIEIIDNSNDIKSEVHKQTKYLLVDEFQDLSPLEQKFVEKICGDQNGLAVFGDDDQSIYETFRSASPQGIIDFPKTYKNVKNFSIRICRRCSPQILEKAMCCIKNNKKRIEKDRLISFNQSNPGFVYVLQKRSKKNEISWIISKILDLVAKGYHHKDILILFPDGKVAKDYIEEILKANIEAKIQLKVDHVFETELSTWLIATLKWAIDENDNLNLRQCLDYANKIGTETIRQIRLQAISLNCNLWKVIENISRNPLAFKSIRNRKKVATFYQYLAILRSHTDPVKIVDEFFKYLPQSRNDKGCQIIASFIKKYNNGLLTLEDIFDELDQQILDSDNESDSDEKDKLRIMTMHSSKGCEAPIVFIPAMEDDIMPGTDPENIEEKRRLFYVSITRAKIGVFITWANQRTGQEIHMYGRKIFNKQKSIFLKEIESAQLGHS